MANVVVNLATENQQILKESSDVEGRFTFKNIYETGAAVTLAAKYPGYATPLLARHNRLEAPQQ